MAGDFNNDFNNDFGPPQPYVPTGQTASGPYAQMLVYNHPLGATFLVQNNTSVAYNLGKNTTYTNPTGTAELQIFNGTAPMVTPGSFNE